MTELGPIELDDLPAPGDTVGGRYRIEDKIGQGASGVVYAAIHELTGKRVAIKWLRPDLASSEAQTARFLREARAATEIDHPNVVAVFDAGRERGTLFLVMERLRGEPLTAFLARGPYAPELLIATLMPALRGVAAAHERGVVHRDLKPDNVFLDEPRRGWPGGAKILDLGISKLRRPEDGRELTTAGVFLGSPLYMSPEQIVEPSKVDARSDVYSIGAMLYEGLTGRVPHDATSLHELFGKVMREPPASIRAERADVPEPLERIVLRALARDRDARWPSVEALARALEPFAGGARWEETDEHTDADLHRARPSGELEPFEGARTEIGPSPLADPPTDRSGEEAVAPIAWATQPSIELPLDARTSERPSSLPPPPLAGERTMLDVAIPRARDEDGAPRAAPPRSSPEPPDWLTLLPPPLRSPIALGVAGALLVVIGFAIGLAF